MSAENKKQLLTDAQRYLQNTLQKIILETGCVTPTMAVNAGLALTDKTTSYYLLGINTEKNLPTTVLLPRGKIIR